MTKAELMSCPGQGEHFWIRRNREDFYFCPKCGMQLDVWCRQTEALVGGLTALVHMLKPHLDAIADEFGWGCGDIYTRLCEKLGIKP